MRRLEFETYNAEVGASYRVYACGHVLVYTTQEECEHVTGRTRWLASLFVGHPLTQPSRARFVGTLCQDATWQYMWRTIVRWEEEHDDGPG